jgi:hypothetical protein
MNLEPIKKRNIIIGDSINNENYIGKPLYLYQIRNKVNSMKYIGISYRIENRMEFHLSKLRKGNHVCEMLQNDFDSFGEDAFVSEIIFETVFISSDQKALIERLALITMNNLYNTNKYDHKFKKNPKVLIRDRKLFQQQTFEILFSNNKKMEYAYDSPSMLKSKGIKSFRVENVDKNTFDLLKNKMYRDFRNISKISIKYNRYSSVINCIIK